MRWPAGDANECRTQARPGKTLIDATFAIEVGNPTNFPVTFDRAGFVLMVSEHAFVRTPADDESSGPVSVPPGTTVRLDLRFLASGTCTQEMALMPSSAIKRSGRPIQIGAIRFVPVASP